MTTGDLDWNLRRSGDLFVNVDWNAPLPLLPTIIGFICDNARIRPFSAVSGVDWS